MRKWLLYKLIGEELRASPEVKYCRLKTGRISIVFSEVPLTIMLVVESGLLGTLAAQVVKANKSGQAVTHKVDSNLLTRFRASSHGCGSCCT